MGIQNVNDILSARPGDTSAEDQFYNVTQSFFDPLNLLSSQKGKKGDERKVFAPTIDSTGKPSYGLGDYGSNISGAYANQASVNQQQSDYANALRQQMAGKGPSLAQGQLQRGIDLSNAAAMNTALNQRGTNPALAARMAMQQQASNNQNAAAMAAQIRAQEQLAATGMLGNALNTQRGQDLSLYGAAGGLQQGQNQLLQGQAALEQQRAIDQAKLEMQARLANSGVAQNDTDYDRQKSNAILGAAGTAATKSSTSGGGKTTTPTADTKDDFNDSAPFNGEDYADGGEVDNYDVNKIDTSPDVPGTFGEAQAKTYVPDNAPAPYQKYAADDIDSFAAPIKQPTTDQGGLNGGKLSWGDVAKIASFVAANGGEIGRLANSGGHVPGHAVHPGNHPDNDTVPAMLSPGEIVLPRTVSQAEDAPEKAKSFVEAIKAHKSERAPVEYRDVLLAKRNNR